MKKNNTDLELFELATSELRRSNKDKRHPFNYLTFATIGSHSGSPQLRTVVKRQFDDDFNILFYTDVRSEKVMDIEKDGKVSALFYNPRKKLQLRCQCHATLPGTRTKLFRQHKDIVKNMPSTMDYRSKLYPGTPVGSTDEIIYGESLHFALVKLEIYQMDILKLGRKQHKRCLCKKVGKKWITERLVP